MPAAILTFHLRLTGCSSLKEKRSIVKPIIARLHKEFNLSAAEVDLQDHWQETVITCAMAGSDRVFLERAMHEVLAFTARQWPDLPIFAETLEIW